MTEMTYRRLGRSGLKVSVLSFGSWVSFGPQLDVDKAAACMQAARDAGVNFFDNAEVYSAGQSEQIMGDVIAELGWDRSSYVISSKFYWGIKDGVNSRNTLNRKYLMEAIDPSLERLGLDHLDLVFCHRADSETPIEETVWAMHDIVASGRALYWGTSEWSADEIRAAYEIAERHHLHKPLMEQPQYHLMAWSPLASGLLTGKYLDGVPDGSRASLPGYEWLREMLTDPARNDKVRNLKVVADDLGCTLAQLAIAWCASNPNVSTVITGASNPDQVRENMVALEVLAELDDAVLARIDGVME